MNVYAALEFPPAPPDRPYVFINMVATIDGRTVVGNRDEDVAGLGSRTDFALMNRIEAAADGVLVGARTLRATSASWNPAARTRVVVTRSGDLPWNSAYLENGNIIVASDGPISSRNRSEPFRLDGGKDELAGLLRHLRHGTDVRRLVVMGGSALNGQLLAADLVDELFLTIAPRIKLGWDLPTYAEGDPIPRERMPEYHLLEHSAIGDELFVRYRRNIR